MSYGRRTVFLAVGGIVLLVILAQLIPWGSLVPALARTNPPVTSTIKWDSPRTEQLVRTACYDCHSNETTWPWYTNIVPFSWLIAHDTNEGRQKLNFSTQSADQIDPNKLIEQINRGTMPKPIYILLHPAANLSAQDKADLIAGLRASLHGGEGSNNSSQTPMPLLTPPVIPRFGDDSGEGGGEGFNNSNQTPMPLLTPPVIPRFGDDSGEGGG